MRWHRFNQPEDPPEGVSYEQFRWTEVMPGDVVQSWGTYSWRREDIRVRYEKGTKFWRLKTSPVLVLARIPGVPGEPELEGDFVTFVCLTRHGVRVVIGDLNFGKSSDQD